MPQATTFDVLIPGNYFCDLIFTGFAQFPALGTEVYTQGLNVVPGGVMNTVIALQRLAVHVGWVGTLGTDFFSRYIQEQIDAEGLDTSLLARVDAPLQRVTVSVSYPQDRAFITYIDESPKLVDMLLGALARGVRFRHLHFTGLTLDARLPAILEDCRASGVSISMDCQSRPNRLDEPLVQRTLALVDYFMPNASEALMLTGAPTLPESAALLRRFARAVVVKDGANGAHAWVEGAEYHVRPLAFTPIDTTGAGDVFNAGFLCALLAGKDMQTCLQWGNASGGASTQGYGGTSAAPTHDELLRLLGA